MTTALVLIALASSPSAGPMKADESYTYGTPAFGQFVDDSFGRANSAGQFYTWVDRSIARVHYPYPMATATNLMNLLDIEHKQLSYAAPGAARAKKERQLAIWLHRMIKKIMPNFDLDSGFEFRNSVANGQRQCFLQSVFLAGCLQRAGVKAGVTMVNRNIEGVQTNNKHAICLTKLSNGQDVIVDDSEDYAFAKQQGLFVNSASGYKFVRPVYDGDFTIRSYQAYTTGEPIPASAIEPMPRTFITSQFDYYRGERTAGGVMAKRKTPAGLAKAAQFLEKSVQEDPANSLSQYMLGRVFLLQGQKEAATRSLSRAMGLYERQGWVPPDERTALRSVRQYS